MSEYLSTKFQTAQVLELTRDEYEELSRQFSAHYGTAVHERLAKTVQEEIDEKVIDSILKRVCPPKEPNLVDLFNDVFPEE